MKRNLHKIGVLSLSFLLIIGALSGCKGKETTTGVDTNPSAVEKETTGEVKKPDSIKFMINIGMTPEDGPAQFSTEYERLTGIKLDYKGGTPNNEYYQNLELSFTSGTSPDVFNIGDGRLSNYVSQGAVADLTELVEKSEILKNVDPVLFDSIKINGKIYGVPYEEGGGTITYVRQDWLDELNMQAPKNYEEFINMLRAFKAKYPDATPYTAPGLFENQAVIYLREFYQDATPEFTLVDGKWVDGMSEPNMVDALTRLSSAYAEGLIDREIVTNKTTTTRDLWYSGKVGVFNYWSGTWAEFLETRLQANVPTGKVLQLPSIEETLYIQRVPVVTSISSKTKNVEGVFKYFIEFMHDGKEGQLLFESGVENVHWKQDGDNLVQLPKLSKPEEKFEKSIVSPFFAITKKEYTDKNINYDARVLDSIKLLKEDNNFLKNVPMSKTYSKKSSEIIALKSSTIAEIVMGQVSVADGLASYKSKVAALDMATVVEELNANQ